MPGERNVLPVDPKPLNYDLKIKPNFDDFSFEGNVFITLQAEKETDTITFNTIELNYKKITINGEESFEEKDLSFDTHLERCTITLKKAVGPGAVKMECSYTGTMNDKMKGFYRSKYKVDGKEAFMGTTQMEAVDARRVLPCWDEPVHKATFDVTLVVPRDLNALSNMPEKSRSEEGDLATVSFETTPKMSTYLLAWTIAKFDCIQRTIKKSRGGGETLVRVFAAEGKISQGEFALDVACKTLPLYEEFFGSDYPIPKADLLAIPDFAAGAMENWGLITYRENALLCDEKSSQAHREWVALVVTHELAHQWFGNLVTMDWWKELWLNESFATWVEYWATDVLFPEWDIWTRFVSTETMRALELDSLKTSHAVEVQELKNAHEVDEIFDAISYCKGGSILRQTAEYIGIDAIKKGLTEYLEHFKYSNATTKDLWNFLGKAAGKDLTGMLDSWILKQGFPVLHVKKVGDGQLCIRQERYLSTGKASKEEDATIWEIPMILRPASEDATETRLTLSQKENTIYGYASADAVKVNARQTVFCRTKYDAELLPPLQAAIKNKTLGNLDRLGLISDYHAFATSGTGSAVEALKIAMSYENEDDQNVWSCVDLLIGEVKAMLRVDGAEAVAKFETFVHKLYAPALTKIGFTPKEGEAATVSKLRVSLLSRLTSCKYPEAVKACEDMWKNRDTAEISADLRGTVYANQIRNGGADAVAAMKKLYTESSDSMERSRALSALGICPDANLLENEIFQWVLAAESPVRSQDSIYFIRTVAGNPAAEDLYVKIFTTQWSTVFKKFPGMLLTRFVGGISSFYKQSSADALTTFWETVDKKERESMERSFQQGVEGISINVKFAERNAEEVAQFLA